MVFTDGNSLPFLTIGKETVFGVKKPSPAYQRSYSDYRRKFPFKSVSAGRYTLTLTVLTAHVKDVYLAVAEKGE